MNLQQIQQELLKQSSRKLNPHQLKQLWRKLRKQLGRKVPRQLQLRHASLATLSWQQQMLRSGRTQLRKQPLPRPGGFRRPRRTASQLKLSQPRLLLTMILLLRCGAPHVLMSLPAPSEEGGGRGEGTEKLAPLQGPVSQSRFSACIHCLSSHIPPWWC